MKICMVSDFFYPQLGGVEVHIYQLSKELTLRGHKVIIVTHRYGNEVGVRWLQPGIKVYYIPFFSFSFNTIIPTFFLTLPLARQIFLREQIELCHTHQASSVLAFQFTFHAKLLGIKTIHTEHSLFGFSDLTSINLSKVAQLSYFDADKIICVSRTTRENLRLRMNLNVDRFVVIPNALDVSRFQKRKKEKRDGVVRLVTVGRLFYRKGVDLMVEVIPQLFKKHTNLQWTIIGDGPKKYLLEYLVKKHNLENRVKLLGRVDHSLVQQHLSKADIFVNPSLTESFGIAIVEAAAIGLLCVSTDVGAVWEILPPQVLVLAKPNKKSLAESIQRALSMGIEQTENQLDIGEMYSWKKLVVRTQEVYEQAFKRPKTTPKIRLKRILTQNRWSFNMTAILFVFCSIILCLLNFIKPIKNISKPITLHTRLTQRQ